MSSNTSDYEKFDDFTLLFFKECYLKDFDKKDKITEKHNISIATIALICSSYFYYAQEYNIFNNKTCIDYIFILLLVSSLISFVIQFTFLILSMWPKDYKRIPETKEIENYIYDMKKTIDENENEFSIIVTKDIIAENGFKDWLMQSYIEASNNNSYQNDYRTACIKNSIVAAIITVSLLMISIIPYYFLFHSHEKSSNIKVISPIKIERGITMSEKIVKKIDESPKKSINLPKGPKLKTIKDYKLPSKDRIIDSKIPKKSN